MEDIEHRIFLENNKIDKKILLEPIRDKINIFNRMYGLLKTISPCGKKSLLDDLEKLDLEIMNDINDEYADNLSNNEIEAQAPKSKKQTLRTTKLENDEFILDHLVKLGSTRNLGRSTFVELGLKTPLKWLTIIGKYQIKRINVFSYKYNIYINNE